MNFDQIKWRVVSLSSAVGAGLKGGLAGEPKAHRHVLRQRRGAIHKVFTQFMSRAAKVGVSLNSYSPRPQLGAMAVAAPRLRQFFRLFPKARGLALGLTLTAATQLVAGSPLVLSSYD